MKKFVLGLICGIGLTATTAVYAADTIQAYLFPAKFVFNGQDKELNSEYTTLNYNGHAYVPIRFVAENMGATVGYDDELKKITVDYESLLTPQPKVKDSWALRPTTGFHDGMLLFNAGLVFGKGYIDTDNKGLVQTLQFKNQDKQSITIQPLNIEYQILKVDGDQDRLLFSYKLSPLEGEIPVYGWYEANLPVWNLKDPNGNPVTSGKYAAQIVIPNSLDYTIEGNDEVNTLTRLSRFTRWEFDVTQSIIDDFFQATHSESALKEFQK
ncbi:stalk domain-containing protein [Paenibacillus alginolyticus]|uniref:Copper amine oxidase N-terminal domain-containing protein n=1 Tax=Paenibacillus alginolyticus TaxID=59839 RepID=A0ABT4GJ70_9BACL|nr:stalk domain-containing protein [Paenibacillus alginolyticus]MCY9696084.1 copper amine oxidase N-terminal domain-containing protein [Paenibacillus alginolyticus]MEC0143363.1 stalk domain-containing protein [Paenibacillus alginolyticus]